MSKSLTITLGVVSAALAVAVCGQAIHIRQLGREVDQVSSKVDRLESRQKEAVSRAAVEEIQSQLARVEKQAAAAPAAAGAGKPGALPSLVTEDDIQKIVDEKVEEKLQARGAGKQGGQNGDRKMPLHDMAKELGLDPATQAKVAEISNFAKKEIFDLLKTPRPDGSNLVDEIIDGFLGGDAKKAQATFAKVFTEKVPGTDTPFLQAAGLIQERAHQKLVGALGQDLYQRYKHMAVNPENIETGYDPWGEYLAQRSK